MTGLLGRRSAAARSRGTPRRSAARCRGCRPAAGRGVPGARGCLEAGSRPDPPGRVRARGAGLFRAGRAAAGLRPCLAAGAAAPRQRPRSRRRPAAGAAADRALVLEATRPAVTERLPDVRAFLARLAEAEKVLAAADEDVTDMLEAAPGAVIDGRYRLERRLGAGSTAVGLLVTDLTGADRARMRSGCSRWRGTTRRRRGWKARPRCSPASAAPRLVRLVAGPVDRRPDRAGAGVGGGGDARRGAPRAGAAFPGPAGTLGDRPAGGAGRARPGRGGPPGHQAGQPRRPGRPQRPGQAPGPVRLLTVAGRRGRGHRGHPAVPGPVSR